MLAGLFLYALGVVLTLQANIGYAPWDVFHNGISKTTGISIGMASILVGLVLIVIVTLLRERLGLGTILNMLLIGIFIDIILSLPIIPLMEGFVTGIIMLVIGLFVIASASYFYIGSGFGAGPRDSLMVALMRKTKQPVGICRAAVEFASVIIGWSLGGMLGAGTIIFAFGIGFCVQVTFRLLKFDATSVEHETLAQTYRLHKRSLSQLIRTLGETRERK